MSLEIDTDVLIVGAGPVGLFLANECVRRGLRARIIESSASQSEHSKALAVFPRTLEILDMAGLVDPFLGKANRVTSVAVMTRDRRLAEVRFTPEGTPYPFVAMIPQDVTERLLVEHLTGAGGVVEYETQFVSAHEEEDFVKVNMTHRGNRRSSGRPSWLAATVRTAPFGTCSTCRLKAANTQQHSCWRMLTPTNRSPPMSCSCARMNSGPSPFFQ